MLLPEQTRRELAFISSPQCTRDYRVWLCGEKWELFFCYYFIDYIKYEFAPFHLDFFQDCNDLINGKYREIAWICFRESAKTSFAKIFLAWLICYQKRKYINVDSFDRDNSERILFDIIVQLQTNQRLRADFGKLYDTKKSVDEASQTRQANFITKTGIRCEAFSTQDKVRGRLHGTERPDFLLCDDFENNVTKKSQAYTDQVAEHLDEFKSGLSSDAKVLYLGNYITETGNVQKLYDREEYDPRIRTRTVSVIEDGAPSWPEKYVLTNAEATPENKKVSIEERKVFLTLRVFNAEMMNMPVDESDQIFKSEWFRYYTEPPPNLRVYTTVDPAISKSTHADHSAIVTVGVDHKNEKYILEITKKRLNPSELIEGIFRHAERWKPSVVGIEVVAYQQAIAHFLNIEMRRRNHFLTVAQLKNTNKKEERIQGLVSHFSSGSVYHKRGMHDLEDQLLRFNGVCSPRKEDDIIDSLSMQVNLWQEAGADMAEYRKRHGAMVGSMLQVDREGNAQIDIFEKMDRETREFEEHGSVRDTYETQHAEYLGSLGYVDNAF